MCGERSLYFRFLLSFVFFFVFSLCTLLCNLDRKSVV